MQKSHFIFIDDSGDPGFTNDSSDNFVVAAALFVDHNEVKQVDASMSKLRKQLGWKDEHEFKFRKTRKKDIILALETLKHYQYDIYATYISKSDFRNLTPVIDREKLYNWLIKELLISMPLENTKIKIDEHSTKQDMVQAKTYLRREINRMAKPKNYNIKFEKSASNNLIQLADLIVGAINRSLSINKTDRNHYIKIFKDKIVKLEKIRIR